MEFSIEYYNFILKLLTRANEIVEAKSRFVNQNGEQDTIVFDVISHLLCHELNKEAKKHFPKEMFDKIGQLYKGPKEKKVLDQEKATELYKLILDKNAWANIPEDLALPISSQAEQLLKKKFSLIAQTRQADYYFLLETIFGKTQSQQNTYAKNLRNYEYFSEHKLFYENFNDLHRKFKFISYNPETGQSLTKVPFPQGDFLFIEAALSNLGKPPAFPTNQHNWEDMLAEEDSFHDGIHLLGYRDRSYYGTLSITNRVQAKRDRLSDSFYKEINDIKKLLGVLDKKENNINLEEFLAFFALYEKEVIQGIPHQDHSQYQPSLFYHVTDNSSPTDFHHALSVNGTIFGLYRMLPHHKNTDHAFTRLDERYEVLKSNDGENPYEIVKRSNCRTSNLLTMLAEKADFLTFIADEYEKCIQSTTASNDAVNKLKATAKATILVNLFLLDEAHYKNEDGDLDNQEFIESLKHLPDCLYHSNPYKDTPYYSLQDIEAFFDSNFKLNISTRDIPNKLYSTEELEKQDLAEQKQANELAKKQGTDPEEIKKRVATFETKDGEITLPASPTEGVTALEYREDRKKLFFNTIYKKKNFLAKVIDYWKEKNLSPTEIRDLLKQNPVDLSGVSNKNNYHNKMISFLREHHITAIQPTKSELNHIKKNPLSQNQLDKLHIALSKIFISFTEFSNVSPFHMSDLLIEYVKAGYISYDFFRNLLNVEFENVHDLVIKDSRLISQYSEFIESFYQSFSEKHKEHFTQIQKVNDFQSNLKRALAKYRKEKKEQNSSDAESDASGGSDSPQNSIDTSVGDQASSSEYQIAEPAILSPIEHQLHRYKKYLKTLRKKARKKSKSTQQKQLPIAEKTNSAQNQQSSKGKIVALEKAKGKTKTVARSHSVQNSQLAKIVILHKESVHLKATGTDGASHPTSTTSQNSFANKQNNHSQNTDSAKIIDFNKQKKILSSQKNLSKNTVANLKSTRYWKVPLTATETKYLRGLNAVDMTGLAYETYKDLRVLYDYANGVATGDQAVQASIHLSVKATLVTFMRYLSKASPRLALNVSGIGTAAWALEFAMNNKEHFARFFKTIGQGIQLEFKKIFEGGKTKYLPNQKQFDYEQYQNIHKLYKQDPSHRDEFIKQTIGFYSSCRLPIRMAFDHGNETHLSNINFSSEMTYYLKDKPEAKFDEQKFDYTHSPKEVQKMIDEKFNQLIYQYTQNPNVKIDDTLRLNTMKHVVASLKDKLPQNLAIDLKNTYVPAINHTTYKTMNRAGEITEHVLPELTMPSPQKEKSFYPEFGLNMLPLSFVYKLGYKQRFKSISIDGQTYSPLYNHTNGMLLTLEKQNPHELTPRYNLKINLKQNKVTVCEGKSLVGFLALDKDKVIITESNGYKPLTAKEYLAHCQEQYKATNKTLNLTIDMKTIKEMQAKPNLTFEQWQKYESIIANKLLSSMKPHQPSQALSNLLTKTKYE